ncbi:YjzD family protein [Cytobacillus purgationiresistens]|uniref:Membrane protein n=1 Tax=Cytobacillus purgationiresistens TaxID=863449 RepID=A0ABU0ACI5_9BACI|nr:YjzD family protein [Cytobacillus purgationiresistens]MDQ0268755.1 putative membrane protein [Cytobacillus purgationiresistens]
MKYFWTFFWTFLLVHMMTYVVSSMIGVKYEFQTATILSVGMTILLFIIPMILPEGPAEKESIH